LKITFLGTAASVPTTTRSLPAVAVRRKGELLLFDCGEGTQRQMALSNMGLSSKIKIFITHIHGDHVLGLPGLVQSMSLFNRKAPLRVFGPSGLYDFIEAFKETVKFSLTFPIEVREVSEGVIDRGDEYSIKAVWVEHTIPTLAYALIEKKRPGIFYPEKARALGIPEGPFWSKLQRNGRITLPNKQVIISSQVMGLPRRGRKIVYSGDTRPCEAISKLAEGADILIYEATLDDSLSENAYDMGHSTPSQGAKIARDSHVKWLSLTHISGRYLNANEILEQARRVFNKVDVAEDFMEVEVPYTS
jgi:ribonuclease Z